MRSHPAEGGDSHGGVVLVFTNISHASCSLYGYPGAAALDRNGRQFEQARRTLGGYIAGCDCTHPQTVLLAPGGAASSVVEGDNGGGDECLRRQDLLVTAPNTTRAHKVPYAGAYACRLQVHPVLAGTNGGNRH